MSFEVASWKYGNYWIGLMVWVKDVSVVGGLLIGTVSEVELLDSKLMVIVLFYAIFWHFRTTKRAIRELL